MAKEYFEDLAICDKSSGVFITSSCFDNVTSALQYLDGISQELWMTSSDSLTSDFSEDLSGVTLVVRKGVTLTLNGITTIGFNVQMEDGGQVAVDQDCTVNGNPKSKGNTSGVVAFDAVDGDETLTLNGSIDAGLWQVFGSELNITGLIEAYPEWFGAVGDGKTDDRPALQRCFDAIASHATVRLRPGATYELNDDANGNAYVEVIDKSSLTVLANGATVKMGPKTGYNAFYIHSSSGNVDDLDKFEWYGGELFGDKENQNLKDDENDGSTTTYGDGSWDPDRGNTGLMGIRNYKTAYVQNITLRENVSDGICFFNNLFSKADGVYGIDGASPLSNSAYPQTLKWRPGQDGLTCEYIGCKVYNSNIGFSGQDGANRSGTVLIVKGCDAQENYQASFYNEWASDYIYIDNCHLSHSFQPAHCAVKLRPNSKATVSNSYITGGYVNCSASISEDIIINNCVVENCLDSDEYAISGAGTVDSCRIINPAYRGIYANRVSNSILTSFKDQGISGAAQVANCNLSGDGAGSGFALANPEIVSNCTIDNVDVGIKRSGDSLSVANCKITNTQRNSIITFGNSGSGYLKVSDCYLADFGKDTSAVGEERAGIGTSNGDFQFISITGNTFERTDNTVDMCTRSVYLSPGSGSQAICTGNLEWDMQNSRYLSLSPSLERNNLVDGQDDSKIPADLSGSTGYFDGETRLDDGTNTSHRGMACTWDDVNSVWVPHDGGATFT